MRKRLACKLGSRFAELIGPAKESWCPFPHRASLRCWFSIRGWSWRQAIFRFVGVVLLLNQPYWSMESHLTKPMQRTAKAAFSCVGCCPPRRFEFVTVLDDCVPSDRRGDLFDRLLTQFVAPAGRLIISSYANREDPPRALFDELTEVGHPPAGRISIDRPGRFPLVTAWLDA